MKRTRPHPWTIRVTIIGVLLILEVIIFLLAGFLHTGIAIPIGFTVLAEPRIIGATVVEGLCGLFLAVGALALFSGRTWAWRAAFAAHLFAFAGVILAMTALALGAGPRTMMNDLYHIVMLVLLVAGLVLLQTPGVKTELSS